MPIRFGGGSPHGGEAPAANSMVQLFALVRKFTRMSANAVPIVVCVPVIARG